MAEQKQKKSGKLLWKKALVSLISTALSWLFYLNMQPSLEECIEKPRELWYKVYQGSWLNRKRQELASKELAKLGYWERKKAEDEQYEAEIAGLVKRLQADNYEE